ncbi:hypothetical protein JF66_05050 [Cryobacterium sp. MLB-32]|uniref:FtsQ-type POTRA domain-containing protein n=1 Tax=Cryobacterium sp. MLB-32 TaxID=1529318 RepID=UPI0004E6C760|nr:FtsQ-type POTRA domain-containing protein [Cryobacterium sp. MLB-32]KFF60312.1 hypothetical protein JF66_05050 [Cryobacterium sp. MLB-32]
MRRPGSPGHPSPAAEPAGGKKRSGAGGATSGRRTDKADAHTEPIPVQGHKSDSTPLAPVSGIRSGERAQATGQPGVAVAHAVLRAARRARKRFERAEVRRFTWRSRRRRITWLVTLGSIVVVLGAVIGAAYSPLMALRTIEVVGTDRVSSEQVVEALSDQLGTPLPLIDFPRVKSELSGFILIKSFVTESRPPGTLVVRIVERDPIGVITSDAGFDLVDAAGVVIDSTVDRPEGYPHIDSPDGVGSAGFLAAGEVIHALPAGIRSELDSVQAATTDDVTLNLAGGAKVAWGSAERSEYKAVVLAALMVGHPVGSVNEYDVTSPDSAVVR